MELKNDIHAWQRGEGELAHPLLHQVARVEQAGQVMPDVLDVAFRPEPDHREARGLRLRAHDGKVHADQAIEQCRLADVGGAGKGDVASSSHAGS